MCDRDVDRFRRRSFSVSLIKRTFQDHIQRTSRRPPEAVTLPASDCGSVEEVYTKLKHLQRDAHDKRSLAVCPVAEAGRLYLPNIVLGLVQTVVDREQTFVEPYDGQPELVLVLEGAGPRLHDGDRCPTRW